MGEEHPKQLGYKLLTAAGLTFVVSGPGSVAGCYAAVCAQTRVLSRSQERGAGIGQVFSDGLWTAWEGPAGAAIAYSVFPDADQETVFKEIATPFRSVSGPYRWSIVHLGQADPDVASIVDSARLVPVSSLPGLQHLQPAHAAASRPYQQLAEDLRARLLSSGGESIDGGPVKLVMPVDGERTQLLWVGTHGLIQLMSPIAQTTPDGAVPVSLRNLDVSPYEVDTVAGLVVLTLTVRDQTPLSVSVEDVIAQAFAICRYADTLEATISASDDL